MISVGTEIKMNVHIDPVDGYNMDDYDFVCTFFVSNKYYMQINKSEMIRVDENNYIACIDSKKLGYGRVMLRLTAYIPDVDLDDSVRTEVATIDTGVVIGV